MKIHKTRSLGCLGVISLVTALWLVMAWSPAAAQEPRQDNLEPAYVPGEVLVLFKPSVSDLAADATLRRQGGRVISISDDSGIIRVRVEPGQEEAAALELAASADVLLASPNHILYADVTPNDPYYGSQWGMPKIEAPAAWDLTTGSSNVTLAVIDSGLDTALVEFSGRIVHPRDVIDDDSDPQDTCTHGTHVTGIAAAEGNNGVGVAGVAWNVNVMPVRALTYKSGSCTGDEEDIYEGIYWAVAHGAQIINLSLGGPRAAEDDTCEQVYPILSSAVQYAHDAGVLVVAASGNDNGILRCPAYQEEAMAVGATDRGDNRAYYSNYGPGLDVVAPGSDIYSTVPGGGYSYKSGTSMATPHVAGLAALLWSLDASLSRADVQTTIEQTADDLGAAGWDEQFGYGRINARKALGMLGLTVTPTTAVFLIDDFQGPLPAERQLTVSTSVSGVLTWTVTASPTVTWLSELSPISGTVTAGAPAIVTLSVTRPETYGTFTTTLVLDASNEFGTHLQPVTAQVKVNHVAQLYELILMPIFKNYSYSEE